MHSRTQAAYLSAWAALEAAPPGAPLAAARVPWPTPAGREAEAGPLLLAGVPPAARKAALRAEIRRWHPDKFMARHGAALLPAERAAVAARVNAMSQCVAALLQATT